MNATASAAETCRYHAYLSYSHADTRFAAWLHRSLERYRVPARLVGRATAHGSVPRRITPIFRDRDELPASGTLGRELTGAIEGARFLLVVCSPAAARSRWVDKEVDAFKRLNGDGRVLAAIIAGEPGAAALAGREADECFPPSLVIHYAEGTPTATPAEPIAADFRAGKDGRRLALLKIIAGLTGLELDALVQREAQRRVRRFAVLSAASLTGMAGAGALAFYANTQRIEADRQRGVAEREAATAKAASDYLVGTFTLANPETDNPRTITAFTILDRSAERARVELVGQPVVAARLLGTLGQAYNNLGLAEETVRVLQSGQLSIRQAGIEGVDAKLRLANAYLILGRYKAATSEIAQALRTLDTSPRPALRGLAYTIQGRVLAAQMNTESSLSAYKRALAFLVEAKPFDTRLAGSVLLDKALVLADAGRHGEAKASLLDALALYRRAYGDRHLAVGQTWYALAQNALIAAELNDAQRYIARALVIERRVLDPDNPILADALSLQGQILHGQRRFAEAEPPLRQAVAIYRAAFKRPHYLVGIALVYLALIKAEEGRTAQALATLDEAKREYDGSYGQLHANHGDLLVNRAVILAKAGRMAEARADCAAGLAILRRTIGADAAFTRTLAGTCRDLRPG